MAELKTKPTDQPVADFLDGIDEARRKDCKALVKVLKRATGAPPRMWGSSIVGFGRHRYKGATGETDWFLAGFSPRKKDLTVYVPAGLSQTDLLNRLGKHQTGEGCLYLKRLEDIDVANLEQLVRRSVDALRGRAS